MTEPKTEMHQELVVQHDDCKCQIAKKNLSYKFDDSNSLTSTQANNYKNSDEWMLIWRGNEGKLLQGTFCYWAKH